MSALNGVSVLVAGAGLAGLAAARDLTALGAAVTVVDARDRVGGRVWTIRDGFANQQHAEAGGDMIDEDSRPQIRRLAEALGLKLTRILRSGFGYVRHDGGGRPRIVQRNAARGWERLSTSLFESVSHRIVWRSDAGTPQSPSSDGVGHDVAESGRGGRGASRNGDRTARVLPRRPRRAVADRLVDQFSADDAAAPGHVYRIEGGNDRLATVLAAALGRPCT